MKVRVAGLMTGARGPKQTILHCSCAHYSLLKPTWSPLRVSAYGKNNVSGVRRHRTQNCCGNLSRAHGHASALLRNNTLLKALHNIDQMFLFLLALLIHAAAAKVAKLACGPDSATAPVHEVARLAKTKVVSS